MSQIIVLNLRK